MLKQVDKKCCFKKLLLWAILFFRTCLTRMMTTKPIRRKTSTRELMMDSQWIWNRPVNRIMYLSDNLLWGRGGGHLLSRFFWQHCSHVLHNALINWEWSSNELIFSFPCSISLSIYLQLLQIYSEWSQW